MAAPSLELADLLSFPYPAHLPGSLAGLSDISAAALSRLLADTDPATQAGVTALHAQACSARSLHSKRLPILKLSDAKLMLARNPTEQPDGTDDGTKVYGTLTSIRSKWLTYLLDAGRRPIPQPQADGSTRWAKKFTHRCPKADWLGDTGTAALLVIYGGPAEEVAVHRDVVDAVTALAQDRPVVDVLFHDREAGDHDRIVTSLRSGTATNAAAYGDVPWAAPLAS